MLINKMFFFLYLQYHGSRISRKSSGCRITQLDIGRLGEVRCGVYINIHRSSCLFCVNEFLQEIFEQFIFSDWGSIFGLQFCVGEFNWNCGFYLTAFFKEFKREFVQNIVFPL